MRRTSQPLTVFVLYLVCLSGTLAASQPTKSREFDCDIPQLPLTQALEAFFTQCSHTSYGYIPTTPEEERILASPLRGRYTLDEGLRELLPEGFSFDWVTESSVVSIIPPEPTTPPTVPEVTVAQPAMPEGTPKDFIARAGDVRIEQMLVKDSRLWSLEVELPSLIVLRADDIRSLGASTAAEVLEYLPQQPYMRSSGFRLTGEQYADLRGLGPDSTLILINGRRVSASASSFDSNAFDLNTLPLAAVERIEILLDSMAVVAGADATGGVINFILKQHYGTPTLEARYGTAAGGADEMRLSLGADGSIASLRLSGLIDYFSRGELAGAERDRWRDQDYRRFGSADLRSPASYPGNITSSTLDNLPGLSSRFAAVPGDRSDAQITVDDFRATAGTRNLESAYAYRSITPGTDRLSFMGSASLPMSQVTSAFGELLISDRTSTLHDLPVALSNVLVPATNPYNPFEVSVLADCRLSGVGAHLQTTEGRFIRALLGARHEGAQWSGELSLMYVDDQATVTSERDIDPARVADALAQIDPALALNVFDTGSGAASELQRTLVTPAVARHFDSREVQLSAIARGGLFELPAGPVSTLIGVQYRRPEISVRGVAEGDAHRSIASAFTELQVPLVASKGDLGVSTLALNLASRWDRYDDIGSSWNSHAALAWRPAPGLQLRASYGTSYRPPSLWELYQPTMTFPAVLADPKRGNEVASHTVTVGGDPDLEESQATSWSLGFRLRRPAAAGLELSGSWWHVDIDQRLTPITLPALFAREDLFADHIVRAPPSDSDATAGWPGRLIGLDLRSVNVGQLSASGVDLSLSWAIESTLGAFTPSVSATWMQEFTTIDVPGTDATNRVALASIFGTIPKWHATARVKWARGAGSATAAVRFVSRYDDFNVLQNLATKRKIRSRALVDLQASFDLSSIDDSWGLTRNLGLTVGVTDLFDDEPQFAEAGGYFGYDTSQGDLRQRFGYVRLGKRF